MAKRETIIELRMNNQDAVKRLGEWERELIAVRKEQTALRKEIRNSGEATAEQERALGLLSAKAKNLSGNIRELSNDVSGLTSAGMRFRDKMAQAGTEALQAFGLQALTVAGAVTSLISVFRDAAGTVLDFDKALSAVSAIGPEYSANIDQIAEATKTAGIAFGFTAVESVKAVEALGKAGLSVEQILGGGLEGALTLAAAGQIDLASAAETAASALTQFGLAGEDVPRVADALVGGANAAQGGVDELRQALNQSGLVAAQFGLGLEETVGALTTFASAGLLGSDAGTSFRSMLLRLGDPTKESAEAMDQLGIKLFDAQGEFIGIEKTAEQLQVGLKDLTEEQRTQTLATIFGQDAIRAANVLYEKGATGVQEYTKAVTDSGIAERTAAEQTNNLSGDIDRLKRSYDGLVLSIVDGDSKISQFFRSFVTGLGDALAVLAGFDDRTKSIESFTERVQKQFEAIGGEGKLVAEAGDEVVTSLRLMADSVKEFGTEQIDTDLLRLKGKEAAAILAQTIKDGNKVQEAAARATIQIITEQIQERTKEANATIEQIAAREKLAKLDKAAEDAAKRAAEAAAKATGEKEKEADATNKLTEAERKRLDLMAEMQALAAEDATPLAPLDTPVPTDPLTPLGESLLNPDLVQTDAVRNIESYQAEAAAYEELQRQKVDAAMGFGAALAALSKEGSTAAKVGLAIQKAAALAQIVIDTQREIRGYWSNPTWSTFPDGGTAIKTAFTAAAIARAAGSAAIIAGTAIQGFAEGGIVDPRTGVPIRRSNGDNRLATLKVGEMVLTEEQQREIQRRAGFDIFLRAGVPNAGINGGFALGGKMTRGTALVNLTDPVDPPSFRALNQIQSLAEQRASDPNIFVRVTDINKAQGRRAQVLERAEL